MYKITREGPDNVIEVRATGLLEEADYNHLLPKLRAAIEKHDRIRVLLEMQEVEGIIPKALIDEIAFDVEQLEHVERLAVIGDAAWEEALEKLTRPFTQAETRFFARGGKPEARRWLERG